MLLQTNEKTDLDHSATYDVQKSPWYSPIRVIEGFRLLGHEYGDNISKGDFKKAREMFVSAVALLGAYELSEENIYFLQINNQSESPDVMAAKQTERPNGPILLELAQMEVVEFEEHFPSNDLIDFLKKTKLSPKKVYGDKTLIVCMVNRFLPLNHIDIGERIKSLNPKSSIYIIGRSQGDDPAKFVIFSPYPKLTKPIKYDVYESSKKYRIPYRVQFHLGMDDKISYEKIHSDALNIYNMFDLDQSRIEKYKKKIL